VEHRRYTTWGARSIDTHEKMVIDLAKLSERMKMKFS